MIVHYNNKNLLKMFIKNEEKYKYKYNILINFIESLETISGGFKFYGNIHVKQGLFNCFFFKNKIQVF